MKRPIVSVLALIVVLFFWTACTDTGLPLWFKNEIPSYPKAEPYRHFTSGKTVSAFFKTEDKTEIVDSFYKKALVDTKWKLKVSVKPDTNGQIPETASQVWTKGDKWVSIDIVESGTSTRVSIFLTKEEE